MKIEKVVIPAQEKTYWVAEDGRSFSTEEECFAYEKRASIRDVMNERTFSVPNPYESETEYWFIMGEEATPTYLISYIEYFLRVYISYWQKKDFDSSLFRTEKRPEILPYWFKN